MGICIYHCTFINQVQEIFYHIIWGLQLFYRVATGICTCIGDDNDDGTRFVYVQRFFWSAVEVGEKLRWGEEERVNGRISGATSIRCVVCCYLSFSQFSSVTIVIEIDNNDLLVNNLETFIEIL